MDFQEVTFRIVKAVAKLSPSLESRLASYCWFRPSFCRRAGGTKTIIRQTRAMTIDRRGTPPLSVHAAGTSGPAIYFVHGWGGQSSHFRHFIRPFSERHRVLLLDLPAHGSSRGRTTNLSEMADAILLAAEELGPPRAVVTHSVGAACALLAIQRGLPADAVLLIAPPATIDGMVDKICARFGIGSRATSLLKKNLERKFGTETWRQFSTLFHAERMSIPARIVHDVDDAEVPIEEARAIARAWPDSQLAETTGLGHYGPLSDAATVSDCRRWVSERLGTGA